MIMGFRRWVRLLSGAPSLFRLADIMKWSGLSTAAARKASARLCDDGLLWRVGNQAFANRFHPPSLAQVATFIHRPGYISMGSVLAPEASSGLSGEVRCVTLVRPGIHHTPLGTIVFHKAARKLFWGFQAGNDEVLRALPEKALLDLLYLIPDSDVCGYPLKRFSGIDRSRLEQFARHFPAAVRERLRHLDKSGRLPV